MRLAARVVLGLVVVAAGGAGGGCDDKGGGSVSLDGGAADASELGADASPGVPDAAPAAADAAADPADAAPADAGPVPGYALLVTESPPGPDNNNMANWRGVLQFSAATIGEPFVAAPSIDKTAVADPAGLLFHPATGQIFVANRHGNNAADGTAGSISRFGYDPAARTFTPAGVITGNGLAGAHQLALNPMTGELFVANVASGISRFTFDAGGAAIAAGTLSSGPMRGVIVSPDGSTLFVSSATADIRRFELAGGTELPPVTTEAGANLHYFAIRDGDLYVAGLFTDKVYRYGIGAAGALTAKPAIPASDPICVAFSPDGGEMFVAGHLATAIIQRYELDGDAWVPTTNITTTSPLGGIIVLP